MHYIITACLWLFAGLAVVASSSPATDKLRDRPICLMYLTGQHDVIPSNEELIKPITHVALAFMRSDLFLDPDRHEWPVFRTVESTRQAFALSSAKILVAIGGWGDTGFAVAAQDDASRKMFAQNVARMVEATGADGVDIDWEYPGGNGEDYKLVPNSLKTWEIQAYPLLLAAIRAALGPHKLITAAVPGTERDMLAFTPDTVPRIMDSLDFLNVMTYDLMNRRDNVTKHHSSVEGSRAALQAYISRGAPAGRLNLGVGFYVKWVLVYRDCVPAEGTTPLGCKTFLLEDPITGEDFGGMGAFSWHDEVPEELRGLFRWAMSHQMYDEVEGATYYYDLPEALWWTFDGPYSIRRKVGRLVGEMGLGGTFAWGLGEDAPDFTRLEALLGVDVSGSLREGVDDVLEHVKDEL